MDSAHGKKRIIQEGALSPLYYHARAYLLFHLLYVGATMRLGGYSRIGCVVALYCLSLLAFGEAVPDLKLQPTPPFKPLDVKPGFPANDPRFVGNSKISAIMQNVVSARESQFIAKATKAVAVGAEAGSLGIALVTATQIIKDNPAVIDSYRMCGDGVGNANLCSSSSVFSAASGYASGKYGEIVSSNMSSFGNAMVEAGKTTWGLLGFSAGVYKAADLAVQEAGKKIEFIKEGVEKNGLYELKLSNGVTLLSSQKPTPNSPVPVAVSVSGNIFSAKVIEEKQKALNDSAKAPNPPTTYVKEAPPAISQPYPDDAFRVTTKGVKYPYSMSGRDSKGDYYIVGHNPTSIAVYDKLLRLQSNSYVSYYEDTDDNNLSVKIPSRFHLYTVKVKDFQYQVTTTIFGNYPDELTVILQVLDTFVELDNESDICSHQNISDGEKGTRRAVICEPEKARYRTIENSTDEKVYTIFLNTDFSFPEQPKIVDDLSSLGKNSQEALNPSALTNLINNLMNQAVTNADYRGIPMENPVTAAEIAQAANIAGIPLTKGLLYEPVSAPQVWTSAVPSPNPTPNPNPHPGEDDGGDIDLGEDPKIPAPDLEKPPTGEEILKPIKELMPDIKNLNIAAKDVQCPKWDFELWEKKYSFNSHCTLLEKIRPVLKAVFLLIWGLVSLRIILSA